MGGGRWNRRNGSWKTVQRKPRGGGQGGNSDGSGNGKGSGGKGGKGGSAHSGAAGTANGPSAPQKWLNNGWQVWHDGQWYGKPPAAASTRRVAADTTYADIAASRQPVPADQARVGQRIVIPERPEEDSKKTEALRKQCVAVAANIEAYRVAARATGEELSDEDQAHISAMEERLRQLQARRDASKTPEIRYVGSLTKEQQIHKALLAAEDQQAKLSIQANEARKALQAAAEKTAKLREELREAKLRTVRDAAEAGLAQQKPRQATQTMVDALAEQFGVAGNPQVAAFLRQAGDSIAAALEKVTVAQAQSGAEPAGASADRTAGAATGSDGAPDGAPPPPREPPAQVPREPAPAPPAEEAATAPVPVVASPSVPCAQQAVEVVCDARLAQPDVDMRQAASAEQKAAAQPYGVGQPNDSSRLQNLRAALRANLEMGCSALEVETGVASIAAAVQSEAECRVVEPIAKRRPAAGAEDMEDDPADEP